MMKYDLDAVLVGEDHSNWEHSYRSVKIIRRYKPERILYEYFNKKNLFIFLNKEEEIGQSLRGICEKHEMSLEEAGFTEEKLNIEKLKEQLLRVLIYTNPVGLDGKLEQYYTFRDLTYLPIYASTYEKIVSMPLVTYHPAILDYLLKILKKKRKEFGKGLSSEKASKLDKIASILKRVKSASKSFRKSLQVLKLKAYIILSAVYEVGAKIGVCDLEPEEKYKKRREFLEGKISWRDYNNFREMVMADSIEKYVKERQTDAPIIAIMGKAHVKNVAKLLEDRGIRCKVIELRDTIEDRELKIYIKLMYSINFVDDNLE